jgi:hypothetical protein
MTERHRRKITDSTTWITEFFSFARIEEFYDIFDDRNRREKLPILTIIFSEVVEYNLVETLIFCFEDGSFLEYLYECDEELFITRITRFHIR